MNSPRTLLLLLLSIAALTIRAFAVPSAGGPTPAPALTTVPAAATAADLVVLYERQCVRDDSPPPKSYQMTKAMVWKVSGTLSMAGSIYILALVSGKWRTDRKSVDPYQRIMAAYSAFDILFTFFFFFLGPWMVPTETGWWSATGNVATCSLQGFFFIFGWVGSMAYQCLLSLQIMLLVAYTWTPGQFQRRIEYRMHGFIFGLAVVIALPPLFFQGYNPACGNCGPFPFPRQCRDGTVECLRGSVTLTSIYLIILRLLLVATTVFCTGSMIVVYRSVYKQEKKNARYSQGNTHAENHTMSKGIRKRMLLFTSTFYICWILPAVLIFVPAVPNALRLVGEALFPLMGFLNVLVFILPKCVKYQKDHPGTWLPAAYVHVLCGPPLVAITRWTASYRGGSTEQGVAGDTGNVWDVDDDIGLGAYNERVEETPAEGTEDTAVAGAAGRGGEDAPTDSGTRGA